MTEHKQVMKMASEEQTDLDHFKLVVSFDYQRIAE